MLIAMAGLPGTGKSTIARTIAAELGGVVLDKDVVRVALFPPPALDYSSEQDEITMAAIYRAASRILTSSPHLPVILDGRTYRLTRQVRDLWALADSLRITPKVIECICADEHIAVRLATDARDGKHPAGNRTFELYLAMRATSEPLAVPRLTLDTGATPQAECARLAFEYIRRSV